MSRATQMKSKQQAPDRTFEWALIVDDHPLYCDALELTLKSFTQYSQILTANRLEAAFDLISRTSLPSLIVLDLNLPDVTGLEGLMRLKSTAVNCPVIVVSSMGDNAIIGAALGAGAAGFVPKHSSRSVFRSALEAVARGELFKPPGYVEVQGAMDVRGTIDQLASLTRQQTRILECICNGKLNKQIAYDLSITEATVKAHVTAIMRKLGVRSRTQAVLVAQEARFSNLLQSGE
jgi:DNA-binding NarL/FixJ family response regulator